MPVKILDPQLAQLLAAQPALCHEYHKVIKLLDAFEAEVQHLTPLEAEVQRLTRLRAWLEEELLTRIEGHEPH